jgi:hypothetical protein
MATETAERPSGEGDGGDHEHHGDGGFYGRTAVAVSAVVGVLAALLSYWWAQAQAVSTETLFRARPTIEGGGVGADWNAGNTEPLFDAMIALVHAADVIMGVFILVMVFVHWAAFRRLATRMRRPGEGPEPETAVVDGGREVTEDSDGEADSGDQGGETA